MTEQIDGKTDLSRFDNSWYNHGPRWRLVLWFLVNAYFLNTYLPIPVKLKIAVLRLFGAKVGHNVMIKPAVSIKYPWLLEIGNYVWIGEQVWIDNLSQVVIGSNACLSQGAMILTGNHNYRSITFDLTTQPITLEDGVWIGARSVVCAGVRCESHSVLSVNSVATRSLNAYSIYQGNPAVFVRKRTITA
ncbi:MULTISPECIES: WcaF family extracellular polysaccharide biosynthesis acetyltransferase [unclassified Spirosoma]|uniref:WcaF family extracellular polysaccharide biosynthesis acetyltransferase n=1 Tax=unclassified Spirosoma TaxID=2621999 RepID=UPI00095FAF47|nr:MULTISPECIES: WcaF family extracellular polysaccharide biosynthesis acetyltransferase [unclassified Spirosoma]MBN8821352.1 WcaF family extracellular polysaccharide biosynthesis acetyltransferase [Spirosoma sp.]OJW78141.1 MAG: putative colanic acid biosynthesis acetyltransferase [Spirosoma sp. 48-14]